MRLLSPITTLISTLPFLASSTAQSWQPTSTGLTNWEQIHQTLNLYSIVVDTKSWSQLPQIFTSTVSVDYIGFPASGLPAFTGYLEQVVANFSSQHLLGTTLIYVSDDGMSADTTTYVQATLFAKPQLVPTQVVYIYGKYEDRVLKTGEGWRISMRNFTLLGPGLAGNLTLLAGS